MVLTQSSAGRSQECGAVITPLSQLSQLWWKLVTTWQHKPGVGTEDCEVELSEGEMRDNGNICYSSVGFSHLQSPPVRAEIRTTQNSASPPSASLPWPAMTWGKSEILHNENCPSLKGCVFSSPISKIGQAWPSLDADCSQVSQNIK